MTAREASAAVRRLGSEEGAAASLRYFKAGKGGYAEHDHFLGLSAAQLRSLARVFRDLPFPEIATLLASRYNDERALALLILVLRYPKQPAEVYRFYLQKLRRVDNWNLVDASAPYILGRHLLGRSTAVLDRLARSPRLWDRRVAVVATLGLIRAGELEPTLRLCAALLRDPHDLMHKACGWMLREVGKRDERALTQFLESHHSKMPRTMLRYAIERLPERRRKAWLRRGAA